jgi:3',5'-cyclic AMP phosphodiesterase CpdA
MNFTKKYLVTLVKKASCIVTFLIAFPQINYAQDVEVLKILQLTDVHICNLTGYHPAFVFSRQHYGSGVEPLTKFLRTQPEKLDIDAVIITGDLIDYFEAETEKGPLLSTQIEQFVPIYNQCVVPIFLTLGNHDITSYWIEDAEEKESFQISAHQARAVWVRNISCFQNGTYYSRKFLIGETKYYFIFLDNGYNLDNGAFIDKPQLDWLNFQVKAAGSDPVVIFMHKYIPVADLDGDGNAFNTKSPISINEEACSKGFLETLNENKNIKALFVGHGHNNVSEIIHFPSGNKILQSETGAFAQDPHNWRRIDFFESKISVYASGEEKIELELNID